MSKEMIKLLTPQEVLQALIDGQDIEFIEQDSDEWFAFNERFAIKYLYKENLSFRKAMKQEMVTIGNITFPKPYQGEMEYGQIYYFPTVDFKSLWDSTTWTGTPNDFMLMDRSLVHLTKENAIAHAKALLKLSGSIYENQ